MDIYLEPILTGIVCFPFLAFLITLPYLIFEYRKYGSVLFLRTVIVYSFILYLLVSYFLVILPLPPRNLVAHYTSPRLQLRLGQFLQDIIVTNPIVWKDPSTYLSFFQMSTFYTVLFNLFLTVPFGIYLRHYYQKSWYHTIFYSFLLSLFFELTQLSGLYGIYPRSYRLFDVDDLLINTLGGLVGYFIAPIFTKVLPTREVLDEEAFQKGQQVTFFRRGIALLIDLFFWAVLEIFILILFPFFRNMLLNSCLGFFILFFLFPIFFHGKTIGKWIVHLQYVSLEETTAKWYQILLRNTLLYFVILPTPYYIFLLAEEKCSVLYFFFILILGLNYIFFLVQAFKILIGKRKLFGYEMVSGTKNKSTIFYGKKENLEKIDSCKQEE